MNQAGSMNRMENLTKLEKSKDTRNSGNGGLGVSEKLEKGIREKVALFGLYLLFSFRITRGLLYHLVDLIVEIND